uniref:FLYWCH-type domain-containing protein n=1 Tax=Panagrolaimus davidi TaxID=227884 RepID=A0A914QBB8_9BILA
MFEDFSTEKECVKVLSRFHDCEMREFDPEKYESDTMEQIVEAPNFILHKFVICGKKKQRLVIFDSTNKNLCYEYFWDNKEKSLMCCECNNNGHRRRVFATIRENCDGKEYVRLNKLEHICNLREYDPEKFKNDIVFLPSNFKFIEYIENGLTKKKLYLFPSNCEDKNLCYKFAPEKMDKPQYYCVKCRILKAHLCKNNETEYISMKAKKHSCEMTNFQREHDLHTVARKTIKAPNFQIVEHNFTTKKIQKLIIFTVKARL